MASNSTFTREMQERYKGTLPHVHITDERTRCSKLAERILS